MNQQLKNEVNEFCELCDTIGEAIPREKNQITIKEAFVLNVAVFLSYLSMADENVTAQELNFFNEYLELNYSSESIAEIDNDFNVNSEEFLSEPPDILSLFTMIANYFLDKDHEEDGTQLLKYCLQIFSKLGKEFLACDDEVSDKEVQRLTEYLDMMTTYVKKEYSGTIDDFASIDLIGEQVTDINGSESKESLEELLEQLNNLVGLMDVKKDVTSLINLLQIRRIREERGMKKIPMSLHLVFSGNPGTGKTTVARLLSKIYCQLGILSKGHLVEVDRSGLVGGYVGQTAIKVQGVIQKSLGGILFIDEAYSLTANKSDNDYGIEAIDTLVKGMEDHRNDFIVIVAGYPDLMNEFLNSNPGLRSRFNKFIKFADYEPKELLDIFKSLCASAGYEASKDCISCAEKYFAERYVNRDENFANGRDVRNYFETAMINQANRLSTVDNISDDVLNRLELEDVQNIVL